MELLICGNGHRKHELFEKPGGMPEMPFGRTHIRHRLDYMIFRQKRLAERFGGAPNVMVERQQPAAIDQANCLRSDRRIRFHYSTVWGLTGNCLRETGNCDSGRWLDQRFAGEDGGRNAQARKAQSLQAAWECARSAKCSLDFAMVTEAAPLEKENVLDCDIEVVQAEHFGNVRHFARAVAQAGGLHNDVDYRCHLLADKAAG